MTGLLRPAADVAAMEAATKRVAELVMEMAREQVDPLAIIYSLATISGRFAAFRLSGGYRTRIARQNRKAVERAVVEAVVAELTAAQQIVAERAATGRISEAPFPLTRS